MGLPRSTFYDMPATTADEAEIVARMRAICDEFEAYGFVASAPRCATRVSSSTARRSAG